MANYELGTVGFTFQNTGVEDTAADVSLVVQAIERAERQFDSLQKAVARGKITQEQFQRGVQQTENTVNRLSRVLENQASAVEQQAFAYGRAGRGLNEFGFYAQQVGYQVGDFFVQVQSGTNFLVAFGQQATQLAGLVPGVFGAILGIGVSALTALGAAFMRTSESARTFQDALTSANNVLSETKDLVSLAKGDFSSLEEEMGRMTDAAKALAETRIDLGLRDMSDAAKALRDELNEMYNGNAWLNTSRAEELYAAFGFAGTASRELEAALNNLKSQETLQGQVEAATKLRELFLSMAGPVETMTQEELAFYLTIVDAEQASRKLLNRTQEVKGETRNLLDVMNSFVSAANSAASAVKNIGTQASSAVGLVQGLASAMWDAAQARINANAALESMKIEFSPGGQAMMAYGSRTPGGTASQNALGNRNKPITIGGGSGGGGGGGAGDARIISLIESLQTEREVIEEWYAESQTILQTASDAELAIIGGRNEARLRLEQEYQEKLRGIRNAGNAGALGDAEIFFQGMADIAAAGGDRTVKAMRIFSAAQALINSYVAFTEVLKDPSFIGRPWARFGAAASALSSGLAAVAAIKGGGGGSISRGSATVASPSAAAPSPQTVYIDSLEPNSLYSGQTLINLFDAFYNENDKRGKVFVVAR